MRIVLCPSAFYPSVGGVEEHCRNLADRLIQDGHEVRIAVNRHPTTLPKTETVDNVFVQRFSFVSPNRSVRAVTCLPTMLLSLWEFLRWLREFRADVVHVVCPSSNSFYCFLAARILRIPCVTSFHGELFMDANQIYSKSAFARWSLEQLLKVSNAATSCSQFVMNDANSKFDLPSLQEVIYNGIDAAEATDSDDFNLAGKRFILGVGRLVPQKGFDMLIESFTPIAKKYPDLSVVIVGDGSERQNLAVLAKTRGLEHQVIFTGPANRQQVDRIFDHCLFFVLTSPVEPFGIVCLEAMRSGKPVIAFDTGGPPEFITDGVEGILVEPNNLAKLTEAMEKLLGEEPRIKMGQAARIRASSFSWDQVSQKYQRIYQRVTGRESD